MTKKQPKVVYHIERMPPDDEYVSMFRMEEGSTIIAKVAIFTNEYMAEKFRSDMTLLALGNGEAQ
jgi:hypothetical protein